MSGWQRKRFWKSVAVAPLPGGDGHLVTLDGRPLTTPLRRRMVLPARALAGAIAAEWDDQPEVLAPERLPLTRMANSAIDTVADNRAHVRETIAAHGETDLLCYRAAQPGGLVARQAAAWDPLLDWLARSCGARLRVTTGVMHVSQPQPALAAMRRVLDEADDFELAALHELVTLGGSLVIGLAVARQMDAPESLWSLCRVDEEWQAGLWGRDPEAEALAEDRRAAFLRAARFLRLSRPDGHTASG